MPRLDLDNVMVIEEPETGHPEVEGLPEESKAPEIAEATAGGDPVPDDVVETKGDVEETKTVIDVEDTVTAEGPKLAGRPANIAEHASSSDQPKPEAKKMPLSHHTAKAPAGKIDDAAKTKLEQAKERLEDAVWLDPTDLNGRIPYKNINANGRLREIPEKKSKYLRGHALADGLPSPDMDFTNLSMDWMEIRNHLCNKIRNVVDWEILVAWKNRVYLGKPLQRAFSAMLTIAKAVPCKNGLQEAACLFLP